MKHKQTPVSQPLAGAEPELMIKIEVVDLNSLEVIYKDESQIPEVARIILERAIKYTENYSKE
jgi:hypothetical protein